ncbi:hypothetical protein ACH5RR_006474 [Cinchona calisaya]|uniref:Glycine-rich protein n=1 Tax=Cinchona calisaya TaxID=153742 RepID=A0ABD3APG2_9GENT
MIRSTALLVLGFLVLSVSVLSMVAEKSSKKESSCFWVLMGSGARVGPRTSLASGSGSKSSSSSSDLDGTVGSRADSNGKQGGILGLGYGSGYSEEINGK